MNLLEVLGKDLRLRQLTTLRAEIPEAFEGHERRLSEAMMMGLRLVNELADDVTWLQKLIGDLVTVAERDPRFAFLDAIPEAPILSMTRALALERSVFGDETREVAELSLLMGMFTVVLDGLLDEAPLDLQPARAWLDSVMGASRWGDGQPLPDMGVVEHPVTEALGWLTRELTHRLVMQDGWQRDALVRQQFSAAAQSSYSSELESAHCRITDQTATIADSRRRILAKSTAPIWAGALIPFCVHGWPSRINPVEFAELARSIGAFGGWIDDVVDVAVDLHSDRWSMVLLELNDIAQALTAAPRRDDPRPTIVDALRIPFVAGRLASIGRDRLRTIRMGLAKQVTINLALKSRGEG